jgi:DNA invertase Pin-like site-specific DNA recombinase
MEPTTQQQGRSGLGLEAQRSAVKQYLDGGRWRLLKEYTEVESGTHADRPQLAAALHHAKVTGARLVIAKLDRLSRNAAFLLTLRDSGVRFVAADMPAADEVTIGILAVIAQQERKVISERTKAALAEAKRRGTRLGNPNGARCLRGVGNTAAVAAIRRKAQQHAEDLAPVLADMESHGITSLRAQAAELNRREIRQARGATGRWTDVMVWRIRRRLAAAADALRDEHREKIIAGMQRAVKHGKRLGRPRISTTMLRSIRRLLRKGYGLERTAKAVGCAPNTVKSVKQEMTLSNEWVTDSYWNL